MSQPQNTQTLTQTGTNHYGVQDITPDYTGIYAFCITILISVILLLAVGYKIWRELKKDIIDFLQELNSNIKGYLYEQKH